MDKVSELKKSLAKCFDWNKARLDCFARLLLALYTVRTVNLKHIADGFCSRADKESRYRRLKRFFCEFDFNFNLLAQFIFSWFFSSSSKVYLIIDRTNWWWGKSPINILTLSIAYEGMAIPLFWTLIPTGGQSKRKDQIKIIKRFVNVFGIEKIAGVLADREFVNGRFFRWLNASKIPFYIRLKNNSKICVFKHFFRRADWFFTDLNPKTSSFFGAIVSIFGQRLYLAGSRSERGELMIVATNQHPRNAIAIYLRRWEIENLFQGLKGRGFNFEDTHLIRAEKIEKLMALLSLAFCWAHKIGEWKAIKKPILLYQYRHQKRPQYTYFRYGLDYLRDAIINLVYRKNEFKKCLELLDFGLKTFLRDPVS